MVLVVTACATLATDTQPAHVQQQGFVRCTVRERRVCVHHYNVIILFQDTCIVFNSLALKGMVQVALLALQVSHAPWVGLPCDTNFTNKGVRVPTIESKDTCPAGLPVEARDMVDVDEVAAPPPVKSYSSLSGAAFIPESLNSMRLAASCTSLEEQATGI